MTNTLPTKQEHDRVNKGARTTLEISSIGFEGISIARSEDFVVFVEGGLPGDKAEVQIIRKKKRYAEAKILNIIEPSPYRREPICQHFGTCGGCKWQHFEYSEQLRWKKQHVSDCFERLGKIPFQQLLPTIPSPSEFYYRNKMEFTFAASRWLSEQEIATQETLDKDFALGLHAPGRYDKALDLQECHLPERGVEKLLECFRRASKQFDAGAYNVKSHIGFLRNIIYRTAKATNEKMVVLLTSPAKSDAEKNFLDWYYHEFSIEFPEITSIVHAVTERNSGVAFGDILFFKGNEYIVETIFDVHFQISPFSFFQTNPHQLEEFVQQIVSAGKIGKESTVWDLYCGAGTISLPSATRAKKVYGIELSESSVIDARANAERNSITNVEFFHCDLHKPAALEILQSLPRPDVIVIDPPRAGVHEMLLRHILDIAAPKIIYVSCNPATQARDCAILTEKYSINTLQPIDMFPHTHHVENIATLSLIE